MMSKVVVIEPGKKAEVREITKLSLRVMQDIVGGMIECVPLGGNKLLVVNEEGKLDGLPLNFIWHNDQIVGTVLVCRERGADMVGLNDKDIEEVMGVFG